MRSSSFIRALIFMTFLTLGGQSVSAVGEGNRIDMAVSPIRDEFTVTPGTPINRTVQYNNNSDTPYVIYMSVEDCQPSGNYGTPICSTPTGSGVNPEFSSTWIHLSDTNFTVPPHGSKIVSYTVTVPSGAAPGGHYGAIFFNNPDSGTGNLNSVGMIRRIGMLYLMNIPGNIIVNPDVGDILVDGPGGIGNNPLTPMEHGWIIDSPLLQSAPDFVKNLAKDWIPLWGTIADDLNPFWSKPTLSDEPFSVTLKIPVRNDGNIHIRPTGKVYLYDENGVQLKQIGKESVVNENGVFIGEQITDYLPINDEQGNVLPNTERTFDITWRGFAYQDIDLTTKKNEIQFESPGVYYSRLADQGTQFIYPWERLSLIKVRKTLSAKVEFTYYDVTTKSDVVKTLDVPVTIVYFYISKTLNYGMLILIGFILLCAWFFIGRRDRRIKELEHETHDLTDEIAVLEAARKSLGVAERKKKTPRASAATPEKKPSTQAKKTEPTKKAPAPSKTKRTPVKKTATSARKKTDETTEK